MDYLPTIHTRVFSRNQELTYIKKKKSKIVSLKNLSCIADLLMN